MQNCSTLERISNSEKVRKGSRLIVGRDLENPQDGGMIFNND